MNNPKLRRTFLLIIVAGVGITTWNTWHRHQPTHPIALVPEPFRTQLQQISPASSEDAAQLEYWRRWVSSSVWPRFSQDGRYLLLALGEHLRLYEVRSGSLVRQWSLPVTESTPRTGVQLFSAPDENRWYIYSYAMTGTGQVVSSLAGKVYSVTPEQTELGKPLLGLESVQNVSLSGRYLLGASTNTIQLHDRQNGKTVSLEAAQSDHLSGSSLHVDPEDQMLYGDDSKDKQIVFFDLATGKRRPTPTWLVRCGAQICRYLKDTVVTAHSDGTVKVRSRQSPETVLKSYSTPIRSFGRLGMTRDQAFLLAEGVDNKGSVKGEVTSFYTVALDTLGKRRDRMFVRRNPSDSRNEIRTDEDVQFAWNGSYLLYRSYMQGTQYLKQVNLVGTLDTGLEVKVPERVHGPSATVSPNGENLAWIEPRFGDLMLWKIPTRTRK